MQNELRPVADRMDGVPVPSENLQLVQHHQRLAETLKPMLAGQGHHALLVTGDRGIGKATFAFHLARHLLSNGEPTDNVIRQIAQGAHPNLMHLARPWDEKTKKFKTQVSIAQIRKLQGFFAMTAGASGHRIAIIDSADEMNREGSNALLKVLEEPPRRSLFIVLSHSPGRLLPTIRSRCQHLPLRPVEPEAMQPLLAQLQPDANGRDDTRLAQLADGSVRRALLLRDGKLMDDYAIFERLVSANATGSPQDWLLVHRLGDSLAPVARVGDHALFLDLAMGWISSQARRHGGASLAAVAGWAQVWESVGEHIRLAEAYNLDRKQVIVNLFAAIFAQNGRFPAAA
ncbi:MAG: DNA polymerase III subunit delta' [Pseudomonadota bacterium]